MKLPNVIPAQAGIHHVPAKMWWIPALHTTGRARRMCGVRAFAGMTIAAALATHSPAQGFLPPTSSSPTAPSEAQTPLLIGDKVPGTLTVQEAADKSRTLLSYKSPLDILVVAFVSTPCAANTAFWPGFERFHEFYKGWRVAFLAVSQESVAVIPVARDDSNLLAKRFLINQTPALVIIDEGGNLRYRGPLSRDARKAMDAVIGHTEAVPTPEPAMGGACPLQ